MLIGFGFDMGCVLVTSFIDDAFELLPFAVVESEEDDAVIADNERELFESIEFELLRGGLPFVIRCVNESLSLHAIFAVC